jgi:DNA-binding transcriptional regulator YiaG
MKPKKLQPRTARQATRRLDTALQGLQLPARPRKGWIRAIREALGMTPNQLANRMGITRQAVPSLRLPNWTKVPLWAD